MFNSRLRSGEIRVVEINLDRIVSKYIKNFADLGM